MRIILLSTAILSASLGIAAQDWTQWRGPARTGVASAFKPPAEWPERPKRAWKVEAGEGHSSPVVHGARAYLFSRVGDQEALTAYEIADGRQAWRQAYPAPYTMNPAATAHGKGPKSTPLVHGGRIFTLGISGILSAFNEADGRLVWRKDFKGEFPNPSPEFGASMSPVADGGNVIAHVGGDGAGALMAFDAASGAVRWAWKGDGPAYASPIVAEVAGTRQVITQSESSVVSLSAADGTLLWRLPFTTDYEQNIITPTIFDGMVIYGGLSKPTAALRVTHAGGKWNTSQMWSNPDSPMYMSSPVLAGGMLIGLTHRNRGQFIALDARTGRTLWTSPGRQGDNAALVAAGNVVMATTTQGELIVLRQDPKAFTVLRTYTVADSPIWAHPAPAGAGILIKDASSLSYWKF